MNGESEWLAVARKGFKYIKVQKMGCRRMNGRVSAWLLHEREAERG